MFHVLKNFFGWRKKRITVLLGAGAMIEAANVSTKSLTDTVVNACKCYKLPTGQEILTEIINDFNSKHKKDVTEREANFEDLLDILECLFDYEHSNYNDSAGVILSELKAKYQCINYDDVFRLLRKIINTINHTIYDYDQRFATLGIWMNDFFHNLISAENCRLDIFNLNYDTWMEQILGEGSYVDGFRPLKKFRQDLDYDYMLRFSPSEYLSPGKKHTVANLHGQICFEEASFRQDDRNAFCYEEQEYTLYKYTSFERADNYRKLHVRSNLKSQPGHTIFPANIITGRMKTDKLLWSPLQIYMLGLMKALMDNRELLIIGYGFGDQYINTLLFQYLQKHGDKRHTRIVTWVDPQKYEETLLLHGTLFSNTAARFSQCVMKSIKWCNPFHKESKYISQDKNSEIYIDGFKKFCEEYRKSL